MSRVDVFEHSSGTGGPFLGDVEARERTLWSQYSPFRRGWMHFSYDFTLSEAEFCVPGEFLDINQSTEEK